ACDYVKCHADDCGGGGYLTWTQFVVCQESDSSRGLLIAASVLYMLYLFVALGTAADEFFSTTIASIAEQLGISENVAVVSFMTFGNGAPDIFGSVVAVLGVGTPKVGL
ncbi:CRE-NCX-7 protein, partial [Aphelenchoides avenae]